MVQEKDLWILYGVNVPMVLWPVGSDGDTCRVVNSASVLSSTLDILNVGDVVERVEKG